MAHPADQFIDGIRDDALHIRDCRTSRLQSATALTVANIKLIMVLINLSVYQMPRMPTLNKKMFTLDQAADYHPYLIHSVDAPAIARDGFFIHCKPAHRQPAF